MTAAKDSLVSAEYVRNLLDYSVVSGKLYYRDTFLGSGRPVWHRAGVRDIGGVRKIGLKGVMFMEHRVIWLWVTGSWPVGGLFHSDGCKGGNYWINLKELLK